MNRQQWQMKKDAAASHSLPADDVIRRPVRHSAWQYGIDPAGDGSN
jgi:hypothetical protein